MAGRPNASRASWPLEDAKARLSEVVRRAIHGRDSAVVVAAEDYDRERAHRTGEHLIAALAASPAGDLGLDRRFVDGPVRDVEL